MLIIEDMTLIGQHVPQFTTNAVLPGRQVSTEFSLERYINDKNVLLFFFPAAFDQLSKEELIELESVYDKIKDLNTEIVACSTDSELALVHWLENMSAHDLVDIEFPVMSDKTMLIARAFGVLDGDLFVDENNNLGFDGEPVAQRATFFIDKYGVVRYTEVYDRLVKRNCRIYSEVVTRFVSH